MVCTIGQMASAEYYVDSQRSAKSPVEYYASAGEEPDGLWWNPHGLLGLADGGTVHNPTFHRLYRGLAPDGTRLSRMAGSERRSPGLDLTFSPDKTVSVLWAVADPEVRVEIEKAHFNAVRTALAMVVDGYCSFTRVRRASGEIEVIPGKVFGAMWQHGTSRENDPQLHTHCTIFNLVRTDEDGKWRAWHQHPAYRWMKAAGAIYRCMLAANLQRELGIPVSRHGEDGSLWHVPGMPPELIAHWSKRTAQIEKLAAKVGVDPGRDYASTRGLNKATRKGKSHGVMAMFRHFLWMDEIHEFVADRAAWLRQFFGRDVTITDERAHAMREEIAAIPDSLSRHDAVWSPVSVFERVAQAGVGVLRRPREITDAVASVLLGADVVELDEPARAPEKRAGMLHTRLRATSQTIEVERDVQEMARYLAGARGLGIARETVERHIGAMRGAGHELSEEQAAAIHAATSSDRGIAVIEGAAGSGKTTTLRPIADLHRQQGRRIIATSVAWIAAESLGNDLGETGLALEGLLRSIENGERRLDSDDVVIVDEAGMMPTRLMRRVLEAVNLAGARVILAGDTQQQQPVEAGAGLRLVTGEVGSARVNRIRRQLPDLEDLLHHVHGRDRQQARIEAGMTGAAEAARIFAAYEAMPIKPAVTPWQVTASEAFRDGDAAAGIAAYRARGRFHLGRDLEEMMREIARDWNAWQRANPERTAGVIAQTHDEVLALSHFLREARFAGEKRRPGVDIEVRVGNRRKTAMLNVRAGDRLRVGRTIAGQRLFNGTVIEVDSARAGQRAGGGPPVVTISGRTADGREVSFRLEDLTDGDGMVRLSYAYAMTLASAQGANVDRAWALLTERPAREAVYPAMTRHRERLDVYVLRQPIEQAVRLERPEDAFDAPVTEDDIVARLARRWGREDRKDLAHDYMSAGQKAAVRVANDNADRAARGVVRGVRAQLVERRYAGRVAAAARAVAAVNSEWETMREQARVSGGDVAFAPAFTARWHRQRSAIREARMLHGSGRLVSAMLTRAGVSEDDVTLLERKSASVFSFRRHVQEVRRREELQAAAAAEAAREAGGGDAAAAGVPPEERQIDEPPAWVTGEGAPAARPDEIAAYAGDDGTDVAGEPADAAGGGATGEPDAGGMEIDAGTDAAEAAAAPAAAAAEIDPAETAEAVRADRGPEVAPAAGQEVSGAQAGRAAGGGESGLRPDGAGGPEDDAARRDAADREEAREAAVAEEAAAQGDDEAYAAYVDEQEAMEAVAAEEAAALEAEEAYAAYVDEQDARKAAALAPRPRPAPAPAPKPRPAARPAPRPAARPAAKPAPRPAPRPATRPAAAKPQAPAAAAAPAGDADGARRQWPAGTYIAVAGARYGEIPSEPMVRQVLDALRQRHPDMILVIGKDGPVDELIADWAKATGTKVLLCDAHGGGHEALHDTMFRTPVSIVAAVGQVFQDDGVDALVRRAVSSDMAAYRAANLHGKLIITMRRGHSTALEDDEVVLEEAVRAGRSRGRSL